MHTPSINCICPLLHLYGYNIYVIFTKKDHGHNKIGKYTAKIAIVFIVLLIECSLKLLLHPSCFHYLSGFPIMDKSSKINTL